MHRRRLALRKKQQEWEADWRYAAYKKGQLKQDDYDAARKKHFGEDVEIAPPL